MAHLSIRIPDADLAWLKAEAARQNRDVSHVLRTLVEAHRTRLAPLPVDDLRKHIDRFALLNVRVLDARSGQLLVEPGDGGEGLFETVVQIWVPAHTVTFPEAKAADLIPAPLASVGESAAESMRLNLNIGTPPSPNDPEEPK